MVLEKTLESPLDCKEIKLVSCKGNQSVQWTDVEAKSQYFGHLMRRADSLEKTLMLGMIEGRRRRGEQRTRDSWMASVTQWTEFEEAPGVGDGQGSLAGCSPWVVTDSDRTERLK